MAGMRERLLIIAATLLATSTPAAATDDQPICAARPGKSTAPCTVPAAHWQLETGLVDWSLQKTGGARDTALVIGQTTFKYRLTDRSDIELDVTPWQRVTSRAGRVHDRASGFGDLVVSYKHALSSPNASLQFTLLPYVKVPTASHVLGNGKWEGGLLVPIAYSFPKTALSLNLTPEIDWVADADGNGRHAAMAQVASVGLQLNRKLSISGELWGQCDWDPSGTTRQYSADASAAYLLNNNLQLDAGANFGLNSQTPDVELYSGLSVRF